MGKQTMGTPCLNWRYKTDNKLFRLQTPATPFLRPAHWDRIQMDDFSMGTNAIVAVVSYTVCTINNRLFDSTFVDFYFFCAKSTTT